MSDFEKRFVTSVGLLSLLTVGLVLVRMVATNSNDYLFIIENLWLAWIPLVIAWLLCTDLKRRRWLSWQNIGLSVLWLAFLPNAFYLLTDFIHLQPTGDISLLYDIVMIGSLVINGFVLGFASLYMLHKAALKRLPARQAHLGVVLVLLLSSFAIYLGRELRWSTWDFVSNPSGLILNISDRIIDPLGHFHAVNITGLFFILLSTIYLAIYILLMPSEKR